MQRSSEAGWARTVLLVVLTIIGTALIAAVSFASYYLNDSDRLKALATELTHTYTGRKLEISGPVDLNLSTSPRITVEGLRLGNPAWATEPYLLQAEYLTAQIRLLDLLTGLVNILDFDARRAVVHLEQNADGRSSWEFVDSGVSGVDPENHSDNGAEAASSIDESGWSFMIQGLGLADVTVHGRIDGIEPIDFAVEVLTESTDSASHLTLDGGGTLNGEAWTLSGHLGPLDELISAGRVDLDLDLTVHSTELSVQGQIDDIATLSGIDIALKMYGPDARFYGRFTGVPEVFEGDISLEAALKPTANGYHLTAGGHIASFDVQADVLLSDLVEFDSIEGNIGMRGPDAALIARASGVDGLPAGPFTLAVKGNLNQGNFDLDDLRFETDYARLDAQGSFPEFPETDNGRASVRLEGADIGLLQELLGLSTMTRGPYALSADLRPDTGIFKAELLLGSHTLQAEGVLGEEEGWSGLDISLKAFGPELREVAALFDVEELHGAYEAGVRVIITGSRLELQDLSFTNSPFQLSGAFSLPDMDDPESFTIDFKFDSPSLTEIGRYTEVDGLPNRPLSLQGSVGAREGDYRLGPTTLQIGQARVDIAGSLGRLVTPEGMELDVRVTAPGFNDLLLRDLPEGYGQRPLTVSYRMLGHRDATEIVDLKLDVSDSTLRLDGLLTLSESREGSYVEFSAAGSRFDDLLPPISSFQASTAPYDFSGRFEIPEELVLSFRNLKLTVGRTSASIDGGIDLDTQNQTDLKFTLRAESLAELGRLNNRDLPDIPVDVTGALQGNEDAIDISAFSVRWADSNIEAKGKVELGERPHIQLKGESTLLSFSAVEEVLADEAGGAPESASTGATEKLIPDIPIPFEALQAVDADIEFSISRFEGFTLHLDGVEVLASLTDGALEIERIQYQDPNGSFDLSGYLRPVAESGDFGLKVKGTDADLGVLVSPDQPPDSIPRYTIATDLRSTGSTVAEIAANLDGSLLVSSDGGSISNAALQLWTGDFLNSVVSLLNPFKSDAETFTPMECVVINASIESGLLKLEPGVVMRTNKVNMFVFGTANLATEKLDLVMATQARQGIGLSAASITNPYFKVGGSFVSPQLQVDAKSAALAYSIATATGGISLLVKGVWDRVRGQRNPCPDFLPKS